MKKQGDIASLFRKHEAKTKKIAAEKHVQTQEHEPSRVPAMAEEQSQEQLHHVLIPVVAEE